ncbi:MAG: Twinfilin-1 [Claussenomyces sp. TS43310]|nr:MAG: Twinfilin-1 [Claussenomyces sp. TS43310]
MQSGISASQELHTAFQALVSDSSQRGLLATISKEQLVPGVALSSETPDFFSDLSLLSSHLKDNEAAYIILRRYPDTSDGFVAITYVPNSAPVRQKMLFASTRLTLVRELGIERFRETIFATEKAELTGDGFKKHDQHTQLDAPLTEEEQALGAVKKAEAEEGRGMSGKKSHVSAGLTMPVSEDALNALRSLGDSSGQKNLVQLKFDIPTETIHLASQTTSDASGLSTSISSTEPRFTFFKYLESENTPIIFIYTCPSSSKVKERMVYASSRSYAVTVAEQKAGLTVEKKMEASDPDEISKSTIEEEFKPKVEIKKTFDRPKRPGRR